jgi:CRISPR-associated protein Cmr6
MTAKKPGQLILKKDKPPTTPNNHQSRDRGNNEMPHPWLRETPEPNCNAGFVEYLREMRPIDPDSKDKDPTKVQILQLATTNAQYQERLKELNRRTKAIAGKSATGNVNWFSAQSLWRVRVGGHRGPESILLPAFDALGMPYIPASTLRGVARNQAIRHFMVAEDLDWQAAEKKIAPYFGSLDADGADRSGKVIFLDAYPNGKSSAGGLMVDMANNIWDWKDIPPKYNPNPNAFLSLNQAEFIIGLRPCGECTPKVFQQVRGWLITGLSQGIGAQVNTGYGTMLTKGRSTEKGFLSIKFTIEGQLIHGQQKFSNIEEPYQYDRKGNLKPCIEAAPETRPVAFKSMLRYWFRTFALGVLSINDVQNLESKLFGGIKPQYRGWLKIEVLNGKTMPFEKADDCGVQSGELVLHFSAEVPTELRCEGEQLFKNLTWLMFHLGGVGQGARRPCYERKNRGAPRWRGSDLFSESEDRFWVLPESIDDLQNLFQSRIQCFHKALGAVVEQKLQVRSTGEVSSQQWVEAIDTSAVIFLCTGKDVDCKPYALSIMHSDILKKEVIVEEKTSSHSRKDLSSSPRLSKSHKPTTTTKLIYDPDLCGRTTKDDLKPSPVWISSFGDFQVVTIFGVTEDLDNPRTRFLQTFRKIENNPDYRQIELFAFDRPPQ